MAGRLRGYSNISEVHHDPRASIGVSKPYSPYNSTFQPYQDRPSTTSRPRGRSFTDSLDANDRPQWYWKAIALASQWMVLGGFLILPATFDVTASQYQRFSDAVLSVIIIALLTGGFSLTALLWFAVPSASFRQDSIFVPIASASAFSFVASLYSIAASTRFDLSKATFPVTLGLSGLSTVVYGFLAFLAYRRAKGLSTHRESRLLQSAQGDYFGGYEPQGGTPSIHSAVDTAYSGTYNDPAYYTNYTANMHPTSLSRPASTPDIRNDYSSNQTPPLTEDEILSQNFQNLLKNRNSASTMADSSKSTYRVEWPVDGGPDEEEDGINPVTGRRRQPTFNPDGSVNRPQSRAQHRSRPSTQLKNGLAKAGRAVRGASQSGIDAVIGRGRSPSQDAGGTLSVSRPEDRGHARSKSRDDRRKEIEMNNLT